MGILRTGPKPPEPRDLRYPHPSMQTNQVSQQNYHVALLSGMIIIAIVVVMEQMWCKQYSPRSDGPPGDEETPKPCLIHIRSNRESSRCKGLASEERSPGTPLSSSGHVTVSSGPGDGENLEGQQGSRGPGRNRRGWRQGVLCHLVAKNKIGQTVTCGNLEGRSQCELVDLSAEVFGEKAEMPVGFF